MDRRGIGKSRQRTTLFAMRTKPQAKTPFVLRSGKSPSSFSSLLTTGRTIWGRLRVAAVAVSRWTCWSAAVSAEPVGDRHSRDRCSPICRHLPSPASWGGRPASYRFGVWFFPTIPIAPPWRPQYRNKQPYRSAAGISAVGQTGPKLGRRLDRDSGVGTNRSVVRLAWTIPTRKISALPATHGLRHNPPGQLRSMSCA